MQAFHSVCSERQLVYNLLFRWFVGLSMDDAVWHHAVFSKNRDRLLTSEIARRFFAEINRLAKRFMSDEHFTVDGMLIQARGPHGQVFVRGVEAWASQRSFRRKYGGDDGDGSNFHGQKRSNDTHQSTTDPEARLYRKSYGKESRLAYLGHALVENCNGLIAAAMATQADGHAERDAALLMLDERQKTHSRPIPVGADKAYDTKDFIATARALHVTAHVRKNESGRRSNLDRRTTRHAGYALSLSRRWLVEKTFGWLKQTGPLAQVKLRGLAKIDWVFVFSCAAHNLLRLPRLIASHASKVCSSSAPRSRFGLQPGVKARSPTPRSATQNRPHLPVAHPKLQQRWPGSGYFNKLLKQGTSLGMHSDRLCAQGVAGKRQPAGMSGDTSWRF